MRDWTPIENDNRWEDEEYYDLVRPQADVLAAQWSKIHHDSEWRQFTREFMDDDFSGLEPEEQEYYKSQHKLTNHLERIQLEFIENALFEIGCRMMRPYEHHNEMEKYYEYMERDR